MPVVVLLCVVVERAVKCCERGRTEKCIRALQQRAKPRVGDSRPLNGPCTQRTQPLAYHQVFVQPHAILLLTTPNSGLWYSPSCPRETNQTASTLSRTQLPYDQMTYDPNVQANTSPELDELETNSDVLALRNLHRADLVMLMGYFPKICGLG